MTHLTLPQLCDEIEAGYTAGKSGLDDNMTDLLLELGSRTSEIKELIEKVSRPGFKLVPIEPTWEMQISASTCFRGPGSGHYTDRMDEAKQVWAIMLKEVK